MIELKHIYIQRNKDSTIASAQVLFRIINFIDKMRFLLVSELHFPICGNDQEGLVDVVREMKFQDFNQFVRRGGTARAVMWDR